MNHRRSVDGVDGVDHWGAVVDDLAALSDGGLGGEDGHAVYHRGGVDRGDHWGLVSDQEAGCGGGASQDGGEGNLCRKRIKIESKASEIR